MKRAGFFQSWPTFIEYRPIRPNVLPVGSASAERSFSRLKQIKSYTRSTMDEIRLSDLSVLNVEKELSEKLDFNSVVDTSAKMKNRLDSLCSSQGRPSHGAMKQKSSS